MAIREGDRVMVISGKDLGRESRVARVLPRSGKVIVEGINTAKRHQKARGRELQAGIVDKDMPIDVSNVMLIEPATGEASRVRMRVEPDGLKERIAVKSGNPVPKGA